MSEPSYTISMRVSRDKSAMPPSHPSWMLTSDCSWTRSTLCRLHHGPTTTVSERPFHQTPYQHPAAHGDHVAGRNESMAQWTADKWTEYGFTSRLDEYCKLRHPNTSSPVLKQCRCLHQLSRLEFIGLELSQWEHLQAHLERSCARRRSNYQLVRSRETLDGHLLIVLPLARMQ